MKGILDGEEPGLESYPVGTSVPSSPTITTVSEGKDAAQGKCGGYPWGPMLWTELWHSFVSKL